MAELKEIGFDKVHYEFCLTTVIRSQGTETRKRETGMRENSFSFSRRVTEKGRWTHYPDTEYSRKKNAKGKEEENNNGGVGNKYRLRNRYQKR